MGLSPGMSGRGEPRAARVQVGHSGKCSHPSNVRTHHGHEQKAHDKNRPWSAMRCSYSNIVVVDTFKHQEPRRMRVAFAASLLLIVSLAYGQTVLRGSVRSGSDEPLRDVNIGIRDKNIWTVSNESGEFMLTVDHAGKNDSITFSHIGYEERKFMISELRSKGSNEIVLTRSGVLLNEVVIQPDGYKLVELGTRSYVTMVAGNVKKAGAIIEYARMIRIKRPSRIVDVNINVFNVKVDMASLEIGIYDIKDDAPHNAIVKDRIIVRHKLEDGWNKINLEQYELNIDSSFYISMKYLPRSSDEPEPFRYSGYLFGGVASRTSHDEPWRVSIGPSISLFVTVEQ